MVVRPRVGADDYVALDEHVVDRAGRLGAGVGVHGDPGPAVLEDVAPDDDILHHRLYAPPAPAHRARSEQPQRKAPYDVIIGDPDVAVGPPDLVHGTEAFSVLVVADAGLDDVRASIKQPVPARGVGSASVSVTAESVDVIVLEGEPLEIVPRSKPEIDQMRVPIGVDSFVDLLRLDVVEIEMRDCTALARPKDALRWFVTVGNTMPIIVDLEVSDLDVAPVVNVVGDGEHSVGIEGITVPVSIQDGDVVRVVGGILTVAVPIPPDEHRRVARELEVLGGAHVISRHPALP